MNEELTKEITDMRAKQNGVPSHIRDAFEGARTALLKHINGEELLLNDGGKSNARFTLSEAQTIVAWHSENALEMINRLMAVEQNA